MKDALFLSYLEGVKIAPAVGDKEIAAIKSSTKGILFAGTPHRGADKAEWQATATKLAWFIQKDHSTELLNTLRRNSPVLERQQYSFKDIQQSFAIFTLLEEVGYPKIGKIVEKDSAVLYSASEKEIPIHANHSDMVKFSSQDDNGYQTFTSIIKKIIRDNRPSTTPLPGSGHSSGSGRQALLTYENHVERAHSRDSSSSRRLEELREAQMSTTSDFSR